MEHPIEEINRLLEPGAVTICARNQFATSETAQISCAPLALFTSEGGKDLDPLLAEVREKAHRRDQ